MGKTGASLLPCPDKFEGTTFLHSTQASQSASQGSSFIEGVCTYRKRIFFLMAVQVDQQVAS
ncbi:hypothetical protein [Mastigocladopsis repens]|uniref:hypothetical protein n=1 Tax=Mastigocladopsis repens TaxID=221287 RepID=UPI0002D916E7|nr:hypothetical protein [Mastigocladopsis repens]